MHQWMIRAHGNRSPRQGDCTAASGKSPFPFVSSGGATGAEHGGGSLAACCERSTHSTDPALTSGSSRFHCLQPPLPPWCAAACPASRSPARKGGKPRLCMTWRASSMSRPSRRVRAMVSSSTNCCTRCALRAMFAASATRLELLSEPLGKVGAHSCWCARASSHCVLGGHIGTPCVIHAGKTTK